ncbi:MAG TPA: BON domain-containing protein [Planctomycetaceae bacterium]|jgi:hypothetical protein
MNPSGEQELTLVPTRFATADVADRYNLKWRIAAYFRYRISDLQRIRITVFGTSVALRGKVRSSHEKRLCLECCRHVPGVVRVVDDLTIGEQIPEKQKLDDIPAMSRAVSN